MPPENIEAIQKESLIRIVDDDAEIRGTLSLMLEIEGWRTHAYPGAEAFLVGDQPSMPGVLLLDIEMGGMNGLDLQIEMMERGYSLLIIFITGHASVDAAVDAMRRARDFLQKPVDPDRLLSSLTAAARESVLEASHALGPEEIRKALSELTDRQKEVLLHLLDEEHVRKIAERLQISLRTVQGHRVTIYRKFGIHSFRQLKDLRGDIRAILEA